MNKTLSYLLIGISLFSHSLMADEKTEINSLLNDFLQNVSKVEAHERFWADELVYTSSAGKRFGKSDIVEPMKKAPPAQTSDIRYSSEEVNIKLFGDTAVLTFKLLANHKDETKSYYYNTGTLVKEESLWRVVAWQATKADIE